MAHGNQFRFPARIFRSGDEFRQFREDNNDLLDEQYRREQELGSSDSSISLAGVCGLCLYVTTFRSETIGGEKTPDGRSVPNWREQQLCGCRYELTSRERAVLHLASGWIGDPSWYRAAVLGREDGIARYLSANLRNLSVWRQVGPARTGAGPILDAATESLHMVISSDYLQHVVALDGLLNEIARVLVPGGTFIFTTPFYYNSDTTCSDSRYSHWRGERQQTVWTEPVHQIGWDIVDRIQRAGFADCAARYYWSEELGYMGSYNIIFAAFR